MHLCICTTMYIQILMCVFICNGTWLIVMYIHMYVCMYVCIECWLLPIDTNDSVSLFLFGKYCQLS